MTDCPCDLNGLKVLVTRPEGQAEVLTRAILDCGGRVERLPLLAIEPDVLETDREKLEKAFQFNDLVFVSPNAVRHSLDFLRPGESSRIIAIGEATAALLDDQALRVDLVPNHSTSEALLGDDRLGEMQGRKVLIIRGHGGRELLADGFRALGADVEYAEVYRRTMPPPPSPELLATWRERVDAMIVTSEEMMKNLVELTDFDQNVLQTPLIVISERLQYSAETSGFQHVLQAGNPYPADLLVALCQLVVRRN
ncbi:MAG: uroporphyrinogen-III synthase [Chromatiales bacterium]|jgi:uroporphyrinogen-III synthase